MKRFMKIAAFCVVMALFITSSIFAEQVSAGTQAKARSTVMVTESTNAAAPVLAAYENSAVSSADESGTVLVKASTKKVKKSTENKSKTITKKNKKSKKKTVTPTAVPTPDPNKQKYIALTFDDGPNTITTPQVLDKLEKYGVVASFFLIGTNLNDDVIPVMKRQLALGCEINNHSWDHANMSKMKKDEIKKEIKSTSDKIYEMVGVYPKFFRPPYIATSTDMYENIDLPFICGIGCNDWDSSVSVKDRVDTILSTVKDGDIILLHDVYGNDKTVEALDTIIPKLLDEGYQFVTVSQLFEKEGINSDQKYKIWTNVLQ